MTNTVELTPAELEMIKVKREQEALAKKEAEAKKAIQLEKDIKDKEAYITKQIAVDNAQVQATQNFCTELGGVYKVEVAVHNEEVKIGGNYINPADPQACGYEREILWSKTFVRQRAQIIRPNSTYRIQVQEHITYASKWSSRGTSQGYKMYVYGPGLESNNRAYTRTSKVNEIIKDAIDAADAAKKAEEAKKNAVATTVDRFKAEYPDADVTTDKGWDRGYSRSYVGTTYDMVRIKFANGCSIAYKVYGDGSLGRVSFNLPGTKDEATFCKNLSQMKF